MRFLIEIVSMILLFTTFTRINGQRQGDLCVMAGTIQPGVCRHIMRCSVVLKAASQGLPYQVCASPEHRLIVCCPWIPGEETGLQARCQANTPAPREGDNCTMVDTGRAGVCSRFANCQAAIEAASKGQSPQICTVEGTIPIICCPRVTMAEGDKCFVAETGRAGKCLRFSMCPVAVEAALNGITPQICAFDGSASIVCCEGVVRGDNCTVVETGRAGVCRPFANCQTAKEAASKGIAPQTCKVEGPVQIVCCPLSTVVVEGSQCTMADTGRAGVCRPFANCQTAKEAACKGIFPQTCNVEGTEQNVCCPLTTVEGSHCTLKYTGITGVCRPFSNCQSAKEAAHKGILEQRCDLTDNESELVCCAEAACPPLPKGLVTQQQIGSKAADYCIELADKIHPCQETSSGWTRGNMCPKLTPDSNTVYHQTPIATAAEAPYYGHIGAGQRGNITWQEGPVILVSDQWVLCAASAILWMGGSRYVQFVGLGGVFKPRYNPDEIYGVSKQHLHPLFKGIDSKAHYSIALLQLDRRVTFTAKILPACLHTGTPLPDSGFIQIDSIHRKSTMQRESLKECSRMFPAGKYQRPDGIKHDLEFCSSPVNITGNCWGWYDGAPLTLDNSPRVACTHLLVGLSSSYLNTPCTLTNTRISFFIPWIEGIVWPESGVVV